MRKLRKALILCGWMALLLVISLGITDAVLAPAPLPKQRDFIDILFASKAVVVAIRIAVVFAAIFIALSVVALIARRQWLTRVGPVEVEEMSGLDAENRQLQGKLEAAQEAVDVLEGRAAYTQRVVDKREGR